MFTFIEMVDGVCNAWVSLTKAEVAILVEGFYLAPAGDAPASYYVLDYNGDVVDGCASFEDAGPVL